MRFTTLSLVITKNYICRIIDPKAKEILSDKSFVVSSFTANLAEKLEQQLGYAGYTRQPCGCIEHRSQNPPDFPEDCYEDEPEDGDYDDEDLDDEDEDDEDLEDEDLEDDDFDDNDEDDEDNWEDQHENIPVRNIPNRHAHHHGKDTTIVSESNNDKRQFAVMLKVRKALEEENRKTKLLLAQKEKLEKGERTFAFQSPKQYDQVVYRHILIRKSHDQSWWPHAPFYRTYSTASETTSGGRSAPHE